MNLTQRDFLQRAETVQSLVRNNPYIPHDPFALQALFLSLEDLEALYGGAAGGGKSDALLMGALMYVHVPGYNAILFRKTYTDLKLPEAILSRSHEWLSSTDAAWNGSDHKWTFPSGATLSFGYLNNEKDKYRYQSSAFQFIGFDELTQFESAPYLYLFSRLRRHPDLPVPLRMRAGTNPGGVGHAWVYERFVVDDTRPFVPAKLIDNPHLDYDSYRRSLLELDDITRKQLEDGLWVLDPSGKPFKSEWWRGQNRYLVEAPVTDPIHSRYISWDTALEDKETSAYTSYVIGELLASYRIRLRWVWRDKIIFPELPDKIVNVANQWNFDRKLRGVIVEGKASGKPAIQTVRAGLDGKIASLMREFTPRGSKYERASQAGVWSKRGMIDFPHPSGELEWLPTFETELFNFPESEKSDQVDAFSQLIIYLENFLTTGWHGTIAKARHKSPEPIGRVQRALREAGFNY